MVSLESLWNCIGSNFISRTLWVDWLFQNELWILKRIFSVACLFLNMNLWRSWLVVLPKISDKFKFELMKVYFWQENRQNYETQGQEYYCGCQCFPCALDFSTKGNWRGKCRFLFLTSSISFSKQFITYDGQVLRGATRDVIRMTNFMPFDFLIDCFIASSL